MSTTLQVHPAQGELKTDDAPISVVEPVSHARSKSHRHKLLICLCALLAVTLAGGGFVLYSLWHSRYTPTENSFFTSSFVRGRNVLVIVPHEDDEVNLAYGVTDSFVKAGSRVTIAFETNGDARFAPEIRNREAVQADALMGVTAQHLVFLGYPDHVYNPALYSGEALQVRSGDAGHKKTYAVGGFQDYHTQRFGKPADCTRANLQADLRQLILNLRPDIIFVTDTDEHIDHASLSQVFDRTMGEILHEKNGYQPIVYKGYAYDYAWHGNNDFYQIPFKSAAPSWAPASYNTCYRWEDRVRFPMSGEYLSYTLRGSKLHALLKAYASQNGLAKQCNLQNGDKIFWQRRTDVLYGNVSASSGNASLLNDFVLAGYSDNPLACCWFPDKADSKPTIRISWDTPQDVDELVFYDAPSPAGDVHTVNVSTDSGAPQAYTLPDGSGKPCRLHVDRKDIRNLTIQLTGTGGGIAGFSEIEVLPAQTESTQWIALKDTQDDFCYELPFAAQQALTLPLYGYPSAPANATATLSQGERQLPAPTYDGTAFHVQPLPAGRYCLRVTSGACTTETVLRIGDTMLWERGLQWVERTLGKYLPA